jgi:leucyl aminopeptidase (aminopeptidase T)
MKKGRATEVRADEGEAFLVSMLDQDDGARRIGEVAFGTNRANTRPTGQILFDERMGLVSPRLALRPENRCPPPETPTIFL